MLVAVQPSPPTLHTRSRILDQPVGQHVMPAERALARGLALLDALPALPGSRAGAHILAQLHRVPLRMPSVAGVPALLAVHPGAEHLTARAASHNVVPPHVATVRTPRRLLPLPTADEHADRGIRRLPLPGGEPRCAGAVHRVGHGREPGAPQVQAQRGRGRLEVGRESGAIVEDEILNPRVHAAVKDALEIRHPEESKNQEEQEGDHHQIEKLRDGPQQGQDHELQVLVPGDQSQGPQRPQDPCCLQGADLGIFTSDQVQEGDDHDHKIQHIPGVPQVRHLILRLLHGAHGAHVQGPAGGAAGRALRAPGRGHPRGLGEGPLADQQAVGHYLRQHLCREHHREPEIHPVDDQHLQAVRVVQRAGVGHDTGGENDAPQDHLVKRPVRRHSSAELPERAVAGEQEQGPAGVRAVHRNCGFVS
mmetsp:Transcript_60148/g.161373  ORF Transcript_60148/g.161373 Transcript_60148/m.161373 type:complete len:421 (-) Transcript_60148:871-2133(-)